MTAPASPWGRSRTAPTCCWRCSTTASATCRCSRREARCSASSATSTCWPRDPHPVRAAQGDRRRAGRRRAAPSRAAPQPDADRPAPGRSASAQISAVISVVADALVRRTIDLPSARGLLRTEFAWLSLGSHGRREAVPSSDIDSGMVWAGEAKTRTGAVHARDRRQVLETLRATGWKSDTHGVTATGVVSARSAADWQRSSSDGWTTPRRQGVDGALDRARQPRRCTGPPMRSGRSSLAGRSRRPRLLRPLLEAGARRQAPDGIPEGHRRRALRRASRELRHQAWRACADRRHRPLRRPRRRGHGHLDRRAAARREPRPGRCRQPTPGRSRRPTTCSPRCGWSTRCASSRPECRRTTISTPRH